MQMENRLFDDLARVASGAINTLSGIKDEIETRIRERFERLANDMDLVNREEFDAVRAMAAKARAEQERLQAELAALEARIVELEHRLAEVAGSASSEDQEAASEHATPRRRRSGGESRA
ncbi:MAG: accessory factor UbiK family protein [Geminicoccaceae bacterium]|nr:accessory factor UbiK family protein [Geminicoccaceae bacterium]MDW8371601.1 accessory factor UbiK family protein [Geminicoccaceae bacterium]